jgi:hypothetical protein
MCPVACFGPFQGGSDELTRNMLASYSVCDPAVKATPLHFFIRVVTSPCGVAMQALSIKNLSPVTGGEPELERGF